MKELLLHIPEDDRPLYLRIAEAIRHAVREGQAQPNEPLPSTRRLAAILGAHRHTVMSALDELAAEGWLVGRERRDYVVSSVVPTEFFRPAGSPAPVAVDPLRWRFVRSGSEESLLSEFDGPIVHDFRSGLCDLRMFPEREFRSHLSDALKGARSTVLGYSDPKGHPPFVEALREYLRRVRAVSDREIMVTHGSQEGIFLAAQLLVAPGDAVAVEGLGYQPAWQALQAAGARLVPIPIDDEGLDPDALERLLRRRAIRMIYTTPLHQYPTTVTLTAPRRLRIYELAARFGVPILEDDYDHEFHYRSQPLAPFAANDPAGLVVYVSTFSKVLFPSARLGFLAASREFIGRSTGLRRIVTRQNDGLMQEAVTRWMKEGGFERHLRRMRRFYEERRHALVAALEEARDGGLPFSWRTPDGGMALWLDTGVDADRLASAVRRHGVYVAPESTYRIDGTVGTHLRIGFAGRTPEEIRKGINVIARTAHEVGLC